LTMKFGTMPNQRDIVLVPIPFTDRIYTLAQSIVAKKFGQISLLSR
jgi:hypothetical protein